MELLRNGVPIASQVFTENWQEQSPLSRELSRPFNITYVDIPPAGNHVYTNRIFTQSLTTNGSASYTISLRTINAMLIQT